MSKPGNIFEEIQKSAEDIEKASVALSKMAQLLKGYYDSLLRVGFNEQSALQLTILMQSAWVTAGQSKSR